MGTHYNRITAESVKGIWKDSQIEIEFGKTSEDTIVRVNGTQVINVSAVYLSVKVGKPTRLSLELLPEANK